MTFTIDLIYNTNIKTIQAIYSYKIKAFLDEYLCLSINFYNRFNLQYSHENY